MSESMLLNYPRLPMSSGVQKARAECMAFVEADKYHRLFPFYRYKLFNLTVNEYGDKGQTFLAQLAISSVTFVLPIWKAGFPDDPWPEELLTVAKLFLKGKVVKRDIEDKTMDAYFDMDVGDPVVGNRYRVHRVGVAAYLAGGLIMEGYKLDPVREKLLTHDFTDESNYWIWGAGAEGAASLAYAGRYTQKNDNANKRLEFWQLWLTTFFDDAWEKSMIDRSAKL